MSDSTSMTAMPVADRDAGAMAVEKAIPATEKPYYLKFRHGTFSGILRWEQLNDLWEKVRATGDRGWHTYTVFEPPPTGPVDAEGLDAFITEVDTTLRKLQHYDHCGLVYVDDRETPEFVMVFHPHRVIGCGSQEVGPKLPGWTLSLQPPVDLPVALAPPPKPGFFTPLRALTGGRGLTEPR